MEAAKGGRSGGFVYLDHASSTPIDGRVASLVRKTEAVFANPSALHREGVRAKKVVEESRMRVARVLSASADEIIFTSGGTESANAAIFGIARASASLVKNPHVVISSMEHSAVSAAAQALEREGFSLSVVPATEEGFIDLKSLEKAIRKNTVLVSVMYANNEVGIVQPIGEIMKIIRRARRHSGSRFPFFHTDASQAAGLMPLSVSALGVDAMTLDSGKFYGPKGCGALFLKRGVPFAPLIVGGGQEGGRRAGTENASSIAGFALALEIAEGMREKEIKRLGALDDFFTASVSKAFPRAFLNAKADPLHLAGKGRQRRERIPGNINICFPGLDSEHAVIVLDSLGAAVSSASSCKNLAHGDLSDEEDPCRLSSLRFSFGRSTSKKDLQKTIEALKIAVPMATHKKFSMS